MLQLQGQWVWKRHSKKIKALDQHCCFHISIIWATQGIGNFSFSPNLTLGFELMVGVHRPTKPRTPGRQCLKMTWQEQHVRMVRREQYWCSAMLTSAWIFQPHCPWNCRIVASWTLTLAVPLTLMTAWGSAQGFQYHGFPSLEHCGCILHGVAVLCSPWHVVKAPVPLML